MAVVSLSAPLTALAQLAGKLPRIAPVLSSSQIPDITGADSINLFARAFLHRLRDLGYVDGRNIYPARRSAEGRMERFPDLIRKLVALPVDVIVTVGPGASAAMRASRTTSVIANIDDPVGVGVTGTLAQPTRNVTGVTDSAGPEMYSKRLQLLKEMVPNSARVAAIDLLNRTAQEHPARSEIDAAARALGLTPRPRRRRQRRPARSSLTSHRKGACGLPDRDEQRRHIRGQAFGRRHRRTTATTVCVQLARIRRCRGLISYGPNIPALFGRLAELVDKVLTGTMFADLPFEHPTQYDMVIHLERAKARDSSCRDHCSCALPR